MKRVLISLTCVLCAAQLTAQAAPHYIKLKPVFDTSILPKKQGPFHVQLKHTEIVYPEDPNKLLHGSTNIFDLRAEVEEKTSPVNTVQRGVRGKFYLDLAALLPKIAPDLSHRLEAQIAEAEQKALKGAIADDAPLREQQARVPKTAPIMPEAPHVAAADLNLPNRRGGPSAARPALPDLIAGGGGGIAGGGGGGGGGDAAITAAMKKAKQQSTPTNDLEGALRLAKQKTSEDLSGRIKPTPQIATDLTPKLDAISTDIRKLPDAPNTILPDIAQIEARNVILWDAWHKKFAALVKEPLLKAINEAGSPAGSNTVSLVVLSNHTIQVSLAKKSGNAKFDDAVLRAYRSLNGNAQLAYPPGSMRKSVAFLVDNKHETNNVAAVVNSRTASGDKEVYQSKR